MRDFLSELVSKAQGSSVFAEFIADFAEPVKVNHELLAGAAVIQTADITLASALIPL